MKYLETYRLNNLLNIVLLAGFISFLMVSSFTTHYHKTNDGRIIAHSHISNDSENSNNSYPDHTHKEIEFSFIFSSLNFNSLIDEIRYTHEPKTTSIQKVLPSSDNLIESLFVKTTSNKSPPTHF